MSDALVKIIEESGLAPEQQKPLLDSFGDFFVEAHKIVTKSKIVKVSSEDQIEEMQQAKEYRKQLQRVRIDADKAREKLKEGYLRGGNAVQAIYNDIFKIIKPEEDRLKEQEEFAERAEEKRRAELIQKRTEELSKWVDDVSVYNLAELSTFSYEKLLTDSKTAFEAKKAAEAQAEKARLEKEKEDEAEREKLRLENAKLKKQADEKEAELQKEREEKQKLAREKADDDAKIAKAKLEAEEAEKQKALAPDKDKMRIVYKEIFDLAQKIIAMDFSTDESKKIARELARDLQTANANLVERMKNI